MSTINQATLNVNSVRNLLKYGSVALSSLADKLKLSTDELEAYRDGVTQPEMRTADAIADLLGINRYALYTDDDYRPEEPLTDFRTVGNKPAQLSLAAKKALVHSQRLLKLAQHAGAQKPHLPQIRVDIENAKSIAKSLRQHFGITDSMQLTANGRADFFKTLRRQIEKKDIFVWSVSVDINDFRGACINDAGIWAILFNTQDHNNGARSFTIAHELVHVCIGASGISDPYKTENEIERFCNKVAAIMLAPEHILNHINGDHFFGAENPIDYVRYFSNKMNLSQYMIAIRLREMSVISDQYFKLWLEQYNALHNIQSIFIEPPDGGGGAGVTPDQGKVKIAKYGALLPLLVINAVHDRKINSMEVSRYMGLKRRYFETTLNAAEEFIGAA